MRSRIAPEGRASAPRSVGFASPVRSTFIERKVSARTTFCDAAYEGDDASNQRDMTVVVGRGLASYGATLELIANGAIELVDDTEGHVTLIFRSDPELRAFIALATAALADAERHGIFNGAAIYEASHAD